ncbi:MAG: PA0069 family radical SAM protein [Methylococcaceae bacterium]|nr:PA0069 family radical SAM protein [Methylococcaceae bacterium]
MSRDSSEPPSQPPRLRKGRGAVGNPAVRYSRQRNEAFDDGWFAEEAIPPLVTQVTEEASRTAITRNTSPDIPFEQSVNMYRGCEHGCIYCYARPSHAYVGLSPGLDFESRLMAKSDAPKLLERELAARNYQCKTIALGANTDPYQPIERQRRLTRRILEILLDCRHPVAITTKSALVERDLDLLEALAERRLVQVAISLTTLDRGLARVLEPRAAAPERRLAVIRRLSHAGVPVAALVAPVIPFLTDAEMEALLEQAVAAGASQAQYIILRLPLELKELFADWLEAHVPLKKQHVLNRLAEFHGGELYRSGFGNRQTGTGAYAELMRQRFRLAVRRLGLNVRTLNLDSSQFRPPVLPGQQMSLF